MATATVLPPAAAHQELHSEATKLYYFWEVKDGGIVQTYPGTAFEKRRKHIPHDVKIKDLRPIVDQFTLDKNAFQLVEFTPKEREFLDDEKVEREFYPEAVEFIKKHTGASHVHIVSHMCRRHTFAQAQNDAAAKTDADFVTKNNPARFVHVDQSYRGAEQILYLNMPEEEADERTKNRWAIMNIWAPIVSTVKRDPLAFCDFESLDENDLRTVVANLPPPGAGQYGNVSKNLKHKAKAEYSSNGEAAAIYEVANLAYNPGQQWYYCSDMTPNEAWLFKIFDSKKDGTARCAVHSSFPLEGQDENGTEPRQSMELRAFVFWDDQPVD